MASLNSSLIISPHITHPLHPFTCPPSTLHSFYSLPYHSYPLHHSISFILCHATHPFHPSAFSCSFYSSSYHPSPLHPSIPSHFLYSLPSLIHFIIPHFFNPFIRCHITHPYLPFKFHRSFFIFLIPFFILNQCLSNNTFPPSLSPLTSSYIHFGVPHLIHSSQLCRLGVSLLTHGAECY